MIVSPGRQRGERSRVTRVPLRSSACRFDHRCAAAHGARLDDRRQAAHRPREIRVESGAGAEVGDRQLKRRDLARERLGGLPIIRVLDFERLMAGSEIRGVAIRLPRRPHVDQNRGRQHDTCSDGNRAHRDRRPAHTAGTPIGYKNRVTP